MTKNERNQPMIPVHVRYYLTHMQLMTIRAMHNRFGWNIWFIRRPMFEDPVVVVKCSKDGKECAVIDKDGNVIRDHKLKIRD